MIYNDDEQDRLRQAGVVSAKALKLGTSMVSESTKYLELAEAVEEYIISEGMGLAFPVNISVGSVAAHYTPVPGEETMFQVGDVVKVDCGAHLDGYIGDTASTVEVGTRNWTRLIDASKDALDAAIRLMRPGVDLKDVGAAVENTIMSYGFEPIRNLTGHMLGRYDLHAGINIPNYPEPSNAKIEEGMAFAVEPFATNGAGWITNQGTSNIYKAFDLKDVGKGKLKDVVDVVGGTNNLPFSARYVNQQFPGGHKLLRKLAAKRITYSYPILMEKKKGIVSQAEHTLLITSTGCEVLTKI